MSTAPNEGSGAGLPRRPPPPQPDSSPAPSTPPLTHARTTDASFRTPSPRSHGVNQSPRSVSSESNRGLRNVRTMSEKCRFMTSQTARRRIPYSIGSEPLPLGNESVKSELTAQEEEKITKEAEDLYNQLLPTETSKSKRDQLVQKLESVLKEEFPDNATRVTVFGSSANLLCTSKSDVDICISMKQLETPCLLAEILSKRGMQHIKCVHARSVPIVKIWDPELQLACDLNVNNVVALKNTQLVKAYMEIDPRVRRLALIIKHWAKRRMLNEASGGTLSSYTWTLLVINFLQCRHPPVLPVIAVADNRNRHKDDFSEDVKDQVGFGSANSESLGKLLFKFFRRYGWEIDYGYSVMSVREGRILSKMDKNWYFSTNNRFCVEEPFNTDRNLGNTADDTAVRGIHLELRQAFERVADAKSIAASVCELYEFPKEEPKPVFEKAPSQPAVLAPSDPQSGQGNRNNRGGGGRGNNRQNNQGSQRNPGSGGRRASSAAAYGQMYPSILPGPPIMYPAARFGPGYIYPPQQLRPTPEQLSQQMQALSSEEQNLRFKQLMLTKRQVEQAMNASQLRAAAGGGMSPQGLQGLANQRRAQGIEAGGAQGYVGSRLGLTDDVPATAPLMPAQMYPSQYSSPVSMSLSSSQQGTNTNPSSPNLGQNIPLRHGYQRTATQASPNGSLRSHSQPARAVATPGMTNYAPQPQQYVGHVVPPNHSGQTEMPYFAQAQFPFGQQFVDAYGNVYVQRRAPEPVVRREYVGYGIGGSPRPASMVPDSGFPGVPAFRDPQRQSYQMSPSRGPILSNSMGLDSSRSPSPLGPYGADGTEDYLGSAQSYPFGRNSRQYSDSVMDSRPMETRPMDRSAPVIVNGSDQSNALYLNTNQPSDIQRRRVSDFGTYSGHNQDIFWGMGRPQQSEQLPPAFDQDTDRIHQYPRDDVVNDSSSRGSTMSSQAPSSNGPSHKEPPIPYISPAPAGRNRSSPLSFPQFGDVEHAQPPSAAPGASDQGQSAHLRSSNGIRESTTPSEAKLPAENTRDAVLPNAPLLSPVHETRTPSPSSSKKGERNTAFQINGSNGVSTESYSKITSSSQTAMSPRGKENQNGPVRRENAVSGDASVLTSGQSNINTNPWQQAGRKGKKARTSSLQIGSRGEPLPANEAERKGG